MTQPTQPAHATTADIQNIIQQHKAQATQTVVVPALPPHPTITTQSVTPAQPAAPVPTSTATPAVDDATLTSILNANLDKFIADGQAIVKNHKLRDFVQLGQDIYTAFETGLPTLKGADLKQLAEVVAGYIFDHYIVAVIPAPYGFIAPIVRTLLLTGIDFLAGKAANIKLGVTEGEAEGLYNVEL